MAWVEASYEEKVSMLRRGHCISYFGTDWRKEMREKSCWEKCGSYSWSVAIQEQNNRFDDINLIRKRGGNKHRSARGGGETKRWTRDRVKEVGVWEILREDGRRTRGRAEKKRICPGTLENDSACVKIIYGIHLRGCSVTVRPSLI